MYSVKRHGRTLGTPCEVREKSVLHPGSGPGRGNASTPAPSWISDQDLERKSALPSLSCVLLHVDRYRAVLPGRRAAPAYSCALRVRRAVRPSLRSLSQHFRQAERRSRARQQPLPAWRGPRGSACCLCRRAPGGSWRCSWAARGRPWLPLSSGPRFRGSPLPFMAGSSPSLPMPLGQVVWGRSYPP